MEFGPLPIAEVVGCVLGHTVRLPDGVLKKGRVLTQDDVELLAQSESETVTVARLGADDVGENEAAARIARAINGTGITCEAPLHGRTNLHATAAGLLEVDGELSTLLLGINEGLTFATLAPGSTVWADQLVATAKVIPFGVPESAVSSWEDHADGSGCIHVRPFIGRSVALIQTRLEGTPDRVLDRSATAMERRLGARGSRLACSMRCGHEGAPLVETIQQALHAGAELILILGASQIADRSDVVPQAIRRSGGQLHRFGIPMDPGNLTLIAEIGVVPVLGVPGCARSLRPSGFDRVLDLILAGIPPCEINAASFGVGGLLKEIRSRPQPR